MTEYRARFDAEIDFVNGGGLRAETFRLDLPSADLTEAQIGALLVRHLGLAMVGRVELSNLEVVEEAHKGSRGVADAPVGAAVKVKAFNHLQPHLVSGDPKAEGGRRVLFFSGDDAAAKGEVARLIDRLGFFGIDLGPLSVGGRLVQFPGGPLPALNLVKFG